VSHGELLTTNQVLFEYISIKKLFNCTHDPVGRGTVRTLILLAVHRGVSLGSLSGPSRATSELILVEGICQKPLVSSPMRSSLADRVQSGPRSWILYLYMVKTTKLALGLPTELFG
jgi:hypothetical protein